MNPSAPLERFVPLLRSKNDKRYSIVNGGRSRISSFRSRAFSLMPLCSSASVLAVGEIVFAFSGVEAKSTSLLDSAMVQVAVVD